MIRKVSILIVISISLFSLQAMAENAVIKNPSGGQPPIGSKQLANDLEYQVYYQRAFEAVVWAVPALAIHRLREGFMQLPGVEDNVVIAFSGPAVSKHKAITSNAATPYITAYTDLRKGPVVLEVPAKTEKASLYGQVVDAWQSTIADVGPSGLDKGEGGKYLFIPPNYDKAVPVGYIPVQSTTYRISLVFRSIRGQQATDQDAYEYTQTMKMYYLSEAGTQRSTTFVDGLQYPLYTLPFYDIRALEDLHEIISVEPVKVQDKVMMGMLEGIGIAVDRPFTPSTAQKEAMEQGVIDAYHYIQNLAQRHHEQNIYWPDRHWSFVMVPDNKGGFDYVTDTAVKVDKRAAAWSFFTLYPAKLSEKPATVYLAPIKDSKGQPLQAGKIYKINVPKDIPAQQFWSVTVYDAATWAFLDNPVGRSGLGSFNQVQLKTNSDGSVDVYFGPKAPEGKESNWIPTMGKKPYVWLRLYGPGETFWDKSFKMSDVELITQ
mgnify:CR=1 FL=1